MRQSFKRAITCGAVAVGLAVLLGSASGLMGTAVSQASRAPAGAAPTGGRALPQPGTGSELFGLSCPSSRDCWAVGSYGTSNGAGLNQALHWNGRKWSLVSTPDPGGTASNDSSILFTVSCPSSRNCWAVGTYPTPSGGSHNQVLHWNGTRWSKVPTPDPAGVAMGHFNFLHGVACASSADCWAVGEYQPATVTLNQVLHWNGRIWSKVSVPNPGGTATGGFSELAGVRCTASANCWAVGDYRTPRADLNQALHWNGRRWSTVPTPDPGGTSTVGAVNVLVSVACASSADCWAVGSYGTERPPITLLNQILHWNGKRWLRVAVRNPEGTGAGAINHLGDVACTSPAHCWAVGSYGTSSGFVAVKLLNQAQSWNGKRWSLVRTPQPAGTANGDRNLLSGVRCASSADCWAVGGQDKSGGAALNQALHWNGTTWSIR